MSSIETPPFHQLTTGSGSTDGFLDVTSTTGYKVGAAAWLRGPSGSPAAQFVRINKIVSATKVGVVFIPEGINDPKLLTGAVKYPSSQQNNCSSYPINSTLDQFQQVVALPPTS
jgi:hypothetical protein